MTLEPPPPPLDDDSVEAESHDTPGPTLTHRGMDDRDPWEDWPSGHSPRARARWTGLATISEALEVIALALFFFLAVRAVGQNFIVDGSSMQPTFEDGQLLIVNRLAYRSFDLAWLPGVDNDHWRPFGAPEPGDIVVFRFSESPTGERDFIKRIVAVGGQTVEVRDGTVLVDGAPLDEPYIAEPLNRDTALQRIPDGCVWVLGDNRNASFDSDDWGALNASAIIGRVDLRYWPLSALGRPEHASHPGPAATPAPAAVEDAVCVER